MHECAKNPDRSWWADLEAIPYEDYVALRRDNLRAENQDQSTGTDGIGLSAIVREGPETLTVTLTAPRRPDDPARQRRELIRLLDDLLAGPPLPTPSFEALVAECAAIRRSGEADNQAETERLLRRRYGPIAFKLFRGAYASIPERAKGRSGRKQKIT
jgi:hypothetical protein